MTNNNQERNFKYEKIKENKEIINQRTKLIQVFIIYIYILIYFY
jgi:hypothetical protein